MKRISICIFSCIAIITLANCHSSKKAQSSSTAKVSFDNGIQSIMAANCSPCHIPSKGGNKLPLDNYASVKGEIDDIITRIKLEPGTRGFMPMGRTKLSDSTIAVIEQWKQNGLLEK